MNDEKKKKKLLCAADEDIFQCEVLSQWRDIATVASAVLCLYNLYPRTL